MTLTQILQKIKSVFYTKTEIDSMGGGLSLDETIKSKANSSDLSNYLRLSGGTLSGGISFGGTCYTIVGANTELSSERYVVTTTKGDNLGGALYLYGGDFENSWGEKGNFRLVAQSREKGSKYLLGTPSGSLSWNGKELATQEYVDTNLVSKANDSDVVHKSGDETISGAKTFDSNLVANNGKDGALKIETKQSGCTSIQSLASDGTVGAYLDLCNKNDTQVSWKGGFRLQTSKDQVDLIGHTNGSLQWCRKVVDTIEEQGNGYIRYSNGIQICWGSKTWDSVCNVSWGGMYDTPNGVSVPFPKAFNSPPNVFYTGQVGGNACVIENKVCTSTTQTPTVWLAKNTKADEEQVCTLQYIAIGKWK